MINSLRDTAIKCHEGATTVIRDDIVNQPSNVIVDCVDIKPTALC